MAYQQLEPGLTERRKYPRIKTENAVSYILFDEHMEVLDQGKGKTLNLSQSGTLLKTEKPITGPYILLITLNLEGKKVKVRGKVVNTRQSERLRIFLSGIEFVSGDKEQREAIVAFVKAYNHQKYSCRNKRGGT